MNRKWIAAIATVLALSAGLTAALSAAPQDRGRHLLNRLSRCPPQRAANTGIARRPATVTVQPQHKTD